MEFKGVSIWCYVIFPHHLGDMNNSTLGFSSWLPCHFSLKDPWRKLNAPLKVYLLRLKVIVCKCAFTLVNAYYLFIVLRMAVNWAWVIMGYGLHFALFYTVCAFQLSCQWGCYLFSQGRQKRKGYAMQSKN